MSLYPTMESLRVSDIITGTEAMGMEYGDMNDYMGLDLENLRYNDKGELVIIPMTDQATSCMGKGKEFEKSAKGEEKSIVSSAPSGPLVKPTCPGEIKQGLRRVILCKDGRGKVGLQLVSIDNGIFVSLVRSDSPAALAGIRFGDQLLSIGGNSLAGLSGDRAMDYFRKGPVNGIDVIVRDRPLERTVMVTKDRYGEIGIKLTSGVITAIIKDSSAARNGVLTHHNIVEINGQNVIGLKDKHILELIKLTPDPLRITLLPTSVLKHILRKLHRTDIENDMDRSAPVEY